jgi:serine/threonine protein kinase
MSPEQLLGEEVDQRSDIYSTGVTLFELATQRLPFTDSLVPKLTNAILHQVPPTLRPLAPKLSSEFERIVLKCLEKDPDLRYQSAKELATDMRRLEVTSASGTTPATLPKPPQRWLMPAMAVAGVFALIATTWWLWPRFTRSENTTPALRWEQLTNFNDAAEIPALSARRQAGGVPSRPWQFWKFCKFRPDLVQVLAGWRTLSTHKDPLPETDH